MNHFLIDMPRPAEASGAGRIRPTRGFQATCLPFLLAMSVAIAAPVGGDTLPDHVIFRTAESLSPGLGSLAAMDRRCQGKARAAELDGTWIALLSDSTADAIDRLAAAGADGPFYNTYGQGPQRVAVNLADLFDGEIAATLYFDEFRGAAATDSSVWTATLPDGTYAGSSYDDWRGFSGSARVGRSLSTDSAWLDWFEQSGNKNAHLYCVRSNRDPLFTPVSAPEFSHTIFVSSKTYDGDLGGLEGADAECQQLASTAGMGDRIWRAILSDSKNDAAFRIASRGAVFNTRGELVADSFEDLFDGAVSNYVRFDELGVLHNGRQVWTGSLPNGMRYGPASPAFYKQDWTSSSGSVVVGGTLEKDAGWLDASMSLTQGSLYPARLYCIDGQPDPAIGSIFFDHADLGEQNQFGKAVAVCDFNGDGFDDLAAGVPDEGVGGAARAGAVNILYGSSDGVQADSPDDQLLHQDSFGIVGLAEERDQFGAALAAGDFDDDGFCDLAIGVPGEDVGTIRGAGAVNVIYGTSSGLSTSGDQIWHQGITGVKGAPEPLDSFGEALAVGDFDGDGYADLAAGVPGESVSHYGRAGAVNVIYGSAGGLQTAGDQIWHQGTDLLEGLPEHGDAFGKALTAGDFDGDGFHDLAVGAPFESVGSISFAGAVNVLYGSGSGLSVSGDQIWTQNTTGVQGGAEAHDYFGRALASGDFDGDGYEDLAVGVPLESIDLSSQGLGEVDGAGAVNVLYGSSGGIQAAGNQFWRQGGGGLLAHPAPYDRFGLALSSGDFDGDPYADLAVGAPDEDLESDGAANAGVVQVIYGSGGGLHSSGNQLWSQNIAGVEGVAEDDDGFGGALAAGDFDGNTYCDLAVGVPRESIEASAANSAGAVNVLYGAAGGLQTGSPADQIWHQDSPGVKGVAE